MIEEQDLFQYVATKYEEHLNDLNPGLSDTVAKEIEKCQSYLKFARKFFTTNRLQGMYTADDNCGVILDDGARVLVLPLGDARLPTDPTNNIDTSGSMQIRRSL